MAQVGLSRRNFLRCAGLGAVALASGLSWADTPQKEKRQPNFILILTDDQTYRAIGYNNPAVRTPVLDKLAEQGIVFDHAYVASPICVASRASILTGLFPQQHGAIALNAGGFRKSVVELRDYKTLAHLLEEGGYTTAFCGKSHLDNPRDYGFRLGKEHKSYDDKDAFAFARSFLKNRVGDQRPFFLWVAPRQPHIPLRPAQKWLDLYKDVKLEVPPNFRESPAEGSLFNQGLPSQMFYRDSENTRSYKNMPAGPPRSKEIILEFTRAYYATITHLDYQIGELISQLKTSELYENTVIIYLSDNGYFLGNHGLGNKITMHEESVRVPMFMHWSQLAKKNIRCDALVSSLDIFPTVLDLAGIEKPGYPSGVSLLPLLADPTRNLREFVASECVGVGGRKGTGHRMVRTTRWKYILTGTNEEAMFDELKDPYELENVVGLEPNRVILSRMRQYMKQWMDRVDDAHARPPNVLTGKGDAALFFNIRHSRNTIRLAPAAMRDHASPRGWGLNDSPPNCASLFGVCAPPVFVP